MGAAKRFSAIRHGLIGAFVAAVLASASAQAQVTWDATTGTSGPQDGSGTWSTVDTNWWNGSTDVVWPNLTTSSAIIGANSGAAGTIAVSGSLALNAITFNAPGSGNYTLTGGTLGFAGSSPTITANAAATIGSAITSGVGLTKSGTGTLMLSGIVSNTSGNMSISRGAVTLTGTLTNTASGGVNIGSANGGMLTIAGGSMSTSWSNARAIVIAPGPSQSGTIAISSGGLSASGLLVSEDSGGNGVFTQSGGTVTVGSGNLWLSGNTSSLTVSGGSFASNAYTYFAVGSTSPSTSSISVSGSGSITLATLQYGLSGRNGFTTNVNVGDGAGGGTLQVNNIIWGGATTVASTINFNSGTFVAGGSYSIPTQIATVVKAGGANIDVASTRTLTISNPLVDGTGGGGLTKLGAGTLALSGTNTFTGATRIAAGSLSIGNALALQNSTLDLNTADSGTISAMSQNSMLGGLTGSRNLDMLTRTLSIGNNGSSNTYSGGLSNGGLTKIGSGTLTLSGSSSYSGGTVISSGTVVLGNVAALGATTGAVAVNGGGLDLGGYSVTVGALSGSSGATITSVAAATLTASSASSSTYAGAITGAVALTKLGSGTLTLSASNSYASTTTLSAGQLNINTAYAIGTGTFTLNGGTIDNTSGSALTLATNNPQAWNSDFTFVGSSPLNLSAGAVTLGSVRTVTVTSSTLTVGGGVGGAFGLTKSGAGTLALSASNSYTGNTQIAAGVLNFGNLNAFGSGTVSFTGGSTLQSGAAGTLANAISVGTGVTGTFDSQSNANSLSGVISGSGGFVKAGAGTLTISGTNSYSGGTTISSGTVVLGNAAALGATTGLLAVNGGGLELGGNSVTVGALSGSSGATITSVAAAALTGSSASSSTYAGSITGAVALAKAGAGILTLSGSNSYSGGTTLTGGQVTIANASALGTGTFTTSVDANTNIAFNLPAGGTIANNITITKPGSNRTYSFQQNQNNNVTLAGNIAVASGNGNSFTLNGVSTGTFTLSGSNTFGGDVFTGAGVTIRVGGSNAAGSGVWRPDLTTKMILLDGANFKATVGNAIASYGMETSGTATVSGAVFNRNTANVAVNMPAGAQLSFTSTMYAEGGFTTGTFTKTGAGTWVVSSAFNAMFTYNLNEGGLQIPTFGALSGSTAASLLVLNGGMLQYTGVATTTAKQFTLGANGGSLDASGSGTVAFTSGSAVAFTGSGNRTLALTGTNTGSNTLAAVIGDNGGDKVAIAKTGAGTWVLTGSNSYSGGTTLSAGRLSVGNASALGPGTLTISGGTIDNGSGAALTLATNNAQAWNGDFTFAGSSPLVFGTGPVTLGASMTVTVSASEFTVGGPIGGSYGLTKAGAGMLTLSGSNSFSSGLTVTNGQITVANASALGQGMLTFNKDADTSTYFNLATSGTIANDIAINKPGANRYYYFFQNQTNNLGFAGNINVASGNSLQFRLNGVSTGTFTLTGSNTFGSDVYTGAGVTIRIGGSNAGGGQVWRPDVTTNMVLLDGANFKSNIGNAIASYGMETTGTAIVSGQVFNRNSANVAVNTPAGAQLSFTGPVYAEGGSTTGAFTKTGAGTWVVSSELNTAMTYSIQDGSLQVPQFAALGGSSGASYLVLNGGALRYAGSGESTAKQFTLGANGGSLDGSGSGAVNFTSGSAVAFTGSGNRTLTLTGTNTGNNTLAAAIGDNDADKVSLTKGGAGKWVLSGISSYSGVTTVQAGRLALNGQLTGTGGVTVQSGGEFGGSGLIAGNIGGDGLIGPGNSPGILTVQGQVVPTGTTAFAFELSGTGAPTWSNATASGNDVLRLTNATPFASPLGVGNAVNIYFDVSSLTTNDTFLGGFYSDQTAGALDFNAAIGSPTYQYFVKGDGGGGFAYNGTSYYTLAQYMSGFDPAITGVTASVMTVSSANFSGGTISNGQVTQFVIVPEPGAIALAGIGVAVAGWVFGRRRRRAS